MRVPYCSHDIGEAELHTNDAVGFIRSPTHVQARRWALHRNCLGEVSALSPSLSFRKLPACMHIRVLLIPNLCVQFATLPSEACWLSFHPPPGGVALWRLPDPGVFLLALHREGRHDTTRHHRRQVVVVVVAPVGGGGAVGGGAVVGAELAPEGNLPRSRSRHCSESSFDPPKPSEKVLFQLDKKMPFRFGKQSNSRLPRLSSGVRSTLFLRAAPAGLSLFSKPLSTKEPFQAESPSRMGYSHAPHVIRFRCEGMIFCVNRVGTTTV